VLFGLQATETPFGLLQLKKVYLVEFKENSCLSKARNDDCCGGFQTFSHNSTLEIGGFLASTNISNPWDRDSDRRGGV
jgi:hypothetical protein